MLATESNQPDEAIAAFADLVKNHPNSPWTPDAQVRLIDVKLEQQFDLPGAAALAASAVAWCEQNPAEPSSPPLRDSAGNQQSPLAPGGRGAGGGGDESLTVPPDFDPPRADLPPIREVQYNICLRAGLIEYLQEHKDPALAFFEKAKLLEPKRDFVVVKGEIPTGTERLAFLAKSDPWLTPDAVRNGDQKAKLILMLADLYCEGEQHGKAIELCDRLIGGAAPRSSRDQISYAYFRRARGHYLIAGSAADPDASLADYVAAVASHRRHRGPIPRSSSPQYRVERQAQPRSGGFRLEPLAQGTPQEQRGRPPCALTLEPLTSIRSSMQRPSAC